MLNFENEISKVKDRYLRFFFGWDFFHDGFIDGIKAIDDDVEIIISSYRDWERRNQSTKESLFDEDDFSHDRYKYICIFKNCKHYSSDISDNGYIFLNGRFKDSAKVKEINDKSSKKNYHLRIQTTGGYIDLIFSKFEIRKLIGEIDIPKKVSNILTCSSICNRFKDKNLSEIKSWAKNSDSIYKMMAIHYLGAINDDDAYIFAQNSLAEEDAQISAIWVVGNYGNEEILPELMNEWMKSGGMLKRHIQDAIEKIYFRQKAVNSNE